ncbi:pyridoxal-phosphate-dependent aminotransferase family protein [Pontibacillus salicampi]|uniref:Pyridoxal-phosphate-dependent aminotransferase family protein n=1 Tax=Pontibacillus salicampi TaxID=1449801 RepID=A0ABV6LLJ5_9BACI
MLHDQTFLRTPGPTPIPQRVTHAMNQPMIGHRSKSFAQLFKDTSTRLKPIFGTDQPVYVLTSSGTGALETAVDNVTSKGDKVIVVVAGAFGDRFASICEKHELSTVRLDVPWGESVNQDLLTATLREHQDATAVLVTYNETSTGVLQPIDEIAELVQTHTNALTVVDGVSCIGGVPAYMDRWDIDILVTGSQKAMMLPAGLAFVGVSKRAWERIQANGSSSFYFDLQQYDKQYENGMTPYTPAVSLIQGLQEVCAMLEEETLPEVYKRHEVMKNMTRAGIRALGLPLLTSDEDASPTVTSVKGAEDLDVDAFRNHVRDRFGLSLAGGQKQLKGQIFRIGHMGYCSPVDIITTLSMIEMGLVECGINIELGAGVKAAQEVLINDVPSTSK